MSDFGSLGYVSNGSWGQFSGQKVPLNCHSELVETCMSMKSVQLVRHVWAVKNFVSVAKGKAMAPLQGEMLLNQAY